MHQAALSSALPAHTGLVAHIFHLVAKYVANRKERDIASCYYLLGEDKVEEKDLFRLGKLS